MSAGPERPLYARALRLRHLRPGGLLCFLFFEGTIALAVLLVLAELVVWWAVLVLPATVALIVKVNDVVAGAGTAARTRAVHQRPVHQRAVHQRAGTVRATARAPGADRCGEGPSRALPHHAAQGVGGGLLASMRDHRGLPRYAGRRAH